VSSASVPGGSSSGSRTTVIVLAVIGILAIIVGVLYMADGNSLPSFMTAGSHVHKGNHLARGAVALVIGIALLIGAWFTARKNSSTRAA
jgi:hypothetical protein